MMAALLWLTISAPFGQSIREKLNQPEQATTQTMEENTNPFSGMNEEKHTSSGTLSEYLQEHFFLTAPANLHLCHVSSTERIIYLRYYGELVSPPPEA